MSQSAEHKFAGVPCGIMDQWISAHGVKGSALILDCRTCTHELVPINSTELVFLGKSLLTFLRQGLRIKWEFRMGQYRDDNYREDRPHFRTDGTKVLFETVPV